MELYYDEFKSVWSGEGLIEIRAKHGGFQNGEMRTLANFPIAFLRRGSVLTWNYILDVTQLLVQERGILHHTTTRPINLNSSPQAGTYYFFQELDSEKSFTLLAGPRYEYLWNHTSAAQNEGMADHELDAHHILPVHRREWYAEVWKRPESSITKDELYQVSGVFTLRVDLGQEWEAGHWAFYPYPHDPDLLVIHAFDDVKARANHGQLRRISEIRPTATKDQLLDVRLLRYHYQQCALKHIRGFALFPTFEYYMEHHRASGRTTPPASPPKEGSSS